MFGFLRKLFGNKHERDVKAIRPIVAEINQHFEKLKSLSNDALRNKTTEFRQRIKDHLKAIDHDIAEIKAQVQKETNIGKKQDLFDELDKIRKDRNKEIEVALNRILPEAFAVVKETARRFSLAEPIEVTATDFDREIAGQYASQELRPVVIDGEKAVWRNEWDAAGTHVVWNMVHYDVQLIGGVVLHQGKIAEMATGEGKTLVATLPAYLNGLTGEGLHIVTVNNYLARRDAEWMGPLLNFLFLTVDCIDKYQPHSDGRKKAYRCDITYGTNSEFGFDYLRDNMTHATEDVVQRNFHYAMVDEVDSVLIDDARTPLIISGPTGKDGRAELYKQLKPIVLQLVTEQRKMTGEYLREAKTKIQAGDVKTTEGGGGLALFRAYRGLPKNRPLIKFLSEPGMAGVLRNTENYYLQEQQKNMRHADAPLLFVIEEKNRNVELTPKGNELLGQMTGQPDLFVLEDIGGVLTAIDQNESLSQEDKVRAKDEALQKFSAKTERLHALQQLLKAYALFEKEEEYVVIDGKVKIVDEQTGRIMEGRRYSDGLHQAIEAKEGVEIEGSTQTYATVTLQNFFRMYHKLAGMTGTAETEAQEFWDIYKLDVVVIPTNRAIVRKDHQDLVYKTDKEKYNALIDEVEQLVKAGRPVLVGTTSVQNSELLSRMLGMRNIAHNVLNAKQHAREAEIVAEAGKSAQVTIATNMAGRGTDIKISEEVRKAGGLAIVGTERHESRRVDRQLRGRAGRQGDVGSSQFYVSLEDRLMRLFGSERIARLMDRFGHKEGDVLQHSLITKSIERAQKKVEENNYGIRKRLLEYDDVMNIQRDAIYKRRNNALYGDRLSLELNDMFYSLADEIVSTSKARRSYSEFVQEIIRNFGIQTDISEQEWSNSDQHKLAGKLHDTASVVYDKKFASIAEMIMPIIENIHNNPEAKFVKIAIPFTNNVRGLEVSADIKNAVETQGRSLRHEIERTVTLALIDFAWKEHLRGMDELKDKVQGAMFEQKDPLVIYKIEAFKLFQGLMSKVNREVAMLLFRGTIPVQRQEENAPPQIQQRPEDDRLRREIEAQKRAEIERRRMVEQQKQQYIEQQKQQAEVERQKALAMRKVGRNDLCPCGSGKKYKQCHGLGK